MEPNPDLSPVEDEPARLTALKAAITYLAVSVLWLLSTEQILQAVVDEAVRLSHPQILKNLLFMLLTSGLIFWLVARSIQLRQDARRRLLDSQQWYAALFHGAADPALVFQVSPAGDLGPITEANAQACAILGHSRAALLACGVETIDTAGQLPRHLPHILRAGQALFETAYRRADGHALPVEVNAQVLPGVAGTTRILMVARDLSARHAAALALAESERRYRLLADNAADLIWSQDPQGALSYISPSVRSQLGYTPEELVRDIERMLTPESAAALNAAIQRQLRPLPAPLPERLEIQVQRADGEWRWLEVELTPLRQAGGQSEGVLGVGRDVTARKAAQLRQQQVQRQLAQAQKMEAIGTLAGGIAHDLNNLLAVILGNVELAQLDGETAGPTARRLEGIRMAADRASDLVSKLLIFSRRTPPVPVPLDLNGVLRSLLRMMDRLLGDEITVTLRLAPSLPTTPVDRGQLEQALLNLVVNARDAMPGGGTLTLETDAVTLRGHQTLADGPYVRLRVQDTGVGMDEETRARAFEPFFTTKPVGQGTGLGLATTYGILREHDGLIDVESAIGEGSTFTLLLPAVDASPEEDDRPLITEELPPHGEGRRILLVEDEAPVRLLLEQALARFGYQVTAVSRVAEAQRVLRAAPEPFDVVVSDVLLPDGVGPALVRALPPPHQSAAVLLISGYPRALIGEHFPAGEPSPPLLHKPFTLDRLSAALRELETGSGGVLADDKATP